MGGACIYVKRLFAWYPLQFVKSMPSSLRHPTPWLRAFWNRAYRENVTGLSAMVAYNLMLAVFPFALLVLFVFGQVLKIGGVERASSPTSSGSSRRPSSRPSPTR